MHGHLCSVLLPALLLLAMGAPLPCSCFRGPVAATAAVSTFPDSSLRLMGVYVDPNDTQASNGLDPAVNPIVADLPMDEPPLARTAVGWEPEGIHLTLWTSHTILVSWQTGEPRTGPTANPPEPHTASEVVGRVRFGTSAGRYSETASGGVDTVYRYSYDETAGGTTYQSPILHHVLLKGLQPGQTYHYSVGGAHPNGTSTPDSAEFSFRMLGGLPRELRVGVIGDPGQTYNTSRVLQQLADSKPDVVVMLGDLSYADLYFPNQTDANWSFASPPATQQLRWDAFARLTEPLLARVPGIYIGGNHETEIQTLAGGATFTAFNARYPGPQDPSRIDTAPNTASHYLNATDKMQFANESEYEVHSGYFSLELPHTKVIALSSYLPYSPASRQFRWAAAELAAVDRTATPWLVVIMHSAPRMSYGTDWGMFKELEEFMSFYEPLFYQAQVDLMLSGHVHAYERTLPNYNYTVDPCGTAYIVIGDGGNAEGPESHFVDSATPPAYCADQSLYTQPNYQPTTTGRPTLTYQDSVFCPTSQPAWSAFREPSFGHASLTIANGTTADWAWHRVQNDTLVEADGVTMRRALDCGAKAGPTAPASSGGVKAAAAALAVAAAALTAAAAGFFH